MNKDKAQLPEPQSTRNTRTRRGRNHVRVLSRLVRVIEVLSVVLFSVESQGYIPSLTFALFFGTRYFVYQSIMR